MNFNKKNHYGSAIIAFFPIFPTYSGASEVVYSIYKSWIGKKKLFYLKNASKNSRLNSLIKLVKIPILFLRTYIYFFNKKKKIIIIEGARWVGYSLIFIILVKIFINKAKIIYHAHNIELEIRKKNNSKIIFILTKIFENLVYKLSDYPTAVSIIDQKKIKKIYNKKSYLLENGINLERFKFQKKRKIKNQIIFVGSYLYKPNKIAIENLLYINKKILIKEFANLKIIIVGQGLPKKYLLDNSNIIFFKYLSKNKLNNLMLSSKFVLAPLIKSPGTKIKLIETLLLGIPLIVSNNGMKGIKVFKNNGYPIIYNNYKQLKKKLIIFKKNYKYFYFKANKIKKNYSRHYSMDNIVKNFILKNNLFE